MRLRSIAACAPLAVLAAFAASVAVGHSTLAPSVLDDLRFHQHPGTQLPLDARFLDAGGRSVQLGDFFHGEPVLLVLEYLRCRGICSYVLRDTAAALQRVPLASGQDYEVIALSIDPRDGPPDARAARAMYLPRSAARASGWHFLTGTEPEVRLVAHAVGFPYRYDPAIDQFAHPAGIVIATPQGRVARYLLGLGYRPLDLRLALVEAGGGHIASRVADLLLLCYCYDPGTGRYSLAISNLTRALCGATLLGLAAMVIGLARVRRT
jgi:protein SCO1